MSIDMFPDAAVQYIIDRTPQTDGEQSETGVETADEEKFVVDGVRQWRPLEVLNDPQ